MGGNWWSFNIFVVFLLAVSTALKFDAEQVDWNLNQNEAAINPLDYWGQWQNHTFNPSPKNWRFPFYTLFIDKFVNGDPSNDDANGTYFEHDVMGNQLRHGGDLKGLVDTLDYLQGMGVKALYVAGSPHINLPWGSDAYSPLDLTLLDHHFGTIEDWRNAVTEIHKRNMYVVLDNTMATMGDLIGFEGYLNTTTPFSTKEHRAQWKVDRRYLDFTFSNKYNDTCNYPRFWLETGQPVGPDVTNNLTGCYDSEFDQYGDREAFGVYPDWQRQLAKFASVQDRLREWNPSVREKIQHFSCITIAMLDIDGFRIDKAMQVTVDAQAEWSSYIRQCARSFGKENFFIPGEITGGNTAGSIYLGRGKEPQMAALTLSDAVTLANKTNSSMYIREPGKNALDGGAFHYTIYRSLTRFLGMDGNLASGYDAPLNWVDAWNTMLLTNDMTNANTDLFDPRHMYGATNQDVFRWPGIKLGTQRNLLGLFITTLHMPGIPLLLWGEEQAFYVLDNTANNYIYGRQAMSSALAWQTHGCYSLDSAQYYQFPLESARKGCSDDWNSLDHRDPAAPVRNILKSMYHLRRRFPVLQDGFFLDQLSNKTRIVQMPGSDGVGTETGLWSTMRGRFSETQNFGFGNQSVWLVYHNENTTVNYRFNCSQNSSAIVSPYDAGTVVKNLFFPYEEYTLEASPKKLGFEGSKEFNGCMVELDLTPFAFKVLVPKSVFVTPPPMITEFSPGHDARIESNSSDGSNLLPIVLKFSTALSCDSVRNSIAIESTTEDGRIARLDPRSVNCSDITPMELPKLNGGVPGAWTFRASLVNISDGVHSITVRNASDPNGRVFTDANDKFIFRIGRRDNPVTFPRSANYTQNLLFRRDDGSLYVTQKAAGADKFRYSLDFGSSYSDWEDYVGGNTTLKPKRWSGTKRQAWKGEHVTMQYWSRMAGSSDHVQHGDLDSGSPPRRFPHLFLHGPFNSFGFDAGINNEMKLEADGRWAINFMTEWPAKFQLNAWGMNPDGQADQTAVFGDADGDSILDRMPPSALSETIVNITKIPTYPYLSYRIFVDDGSFRFTVVPSGSRTQQIILFVLLAILPPITGALAIWGFMLSFYKVKFNKFGLLDKKKLVPLAMRRQFARLSPRKEENTSDQEKAISVVPPSPTLQGSFTDITAPRKLKDPVKRRCVLIATMEYDIEDWAIKIKIGGLGVMAHLMGKHLGHQDLIWVVPCVGGIEYPVDNRQESMVVTIFGTPYEVKVQTHVLKNITYVLLDAPVFRQQTKAEPYPSRMDDLDSAIYYSAWNQCIAETMRRFPVDLYHINDYHGAVAPLYLLPQTLPCAFSLHNAEFQGLWPMRTVNECVEVCSVYNLEPAVVEKYVQFGSVFNLLHAGSSYLRLHQRGFGAVGVSKKYGKRAFARYPIFWGLSKVGHLPNPDPTDLTDWDGKAPKDSDVVIDPEFEAARPGLKRQAQEWAGLEENPDADLMVFVGRWSMQKGVDLIADIMPSILEENPNVQLICVGPVIDLHGKFAALKLSRMMEVYPKRVFSKPEFTALPPYIFSGAEFALIPSRDEPFGLVAVEFGRKGALGVGARVGGLGNMPGWWYTVESTTTAHAINQFKMACKEALACKQETRAMMRARSAKQRFPVPKWVEQLEALQSTAIKLYTKETSRATSRSRPSSSYGATSGATTPKSGAVTPSRHSRHFSSRFSEALGFSPSPNRQGSPSRDDERTKPTAIVSLGLQVGPGHKKSANLEPPPDDRNRGASSDEEAGDEDYRGRRLESEVTMTREEAREMGMMDVIKTQQRSRPAIANFSSSSRNSEVNLQSLASMSPGTMTPGTDVPDVPDLPQPHSVFMQAQTSSLSLNEIVGDRTDFKLQRVDPFFTDSTGEFYAQFSEKLASLSGKTSENDLCIEEFLVKSEKKWFNRFKDAKLGIGSPAPSPGSSIYHGRRGRHSAAASTLVNSNTPSAQPSVVNTPAQSVYFDHRDQDELSQRSQEDSPKEEKLNRVSTNDEFALGKDFKPPTGLRKLLSLRIGDWPLYSFLLAFGQIIAANSYQITLLTGEVGQTAEKLYVIASIYLAASIIWWALFRSLKAMFTLATPFFIYGMAFMLIAINPWVPMSSRYWVQNVATGLYAFASASGSFYFGLNWGDQGGAPVKDWMYRACVIQGTQQLYVVALWYWGSTLTRQTASGQEVVNPIIYSWRITAITGSITVLLFTVGAVLFTGLPDYYRQSPGKIPSFYSSLYRRKIIIWFFIVVAIQNYWLSAPYGRNWSYLWSSRYPKAWQITLLILFFFVVVWAAFLVLFGYLSRSHSWILPLFAVGLLAPRWGQILWGISNIGAYVPWAGGPLASALVGRALWLWLGTLDSLQGVGFGMILLQTLTRIHVVFTLVAAQVIGSAFTIAARASAPNKIGPGDVFPDLSGGIIEGLSKAWFWVGLIFQLSICLGFFIFFRKEQLQKP